MSEEVVVHPSHLGNIPGNVQMQLRQMYIDMSCPRLGIGLKVLSVVINSTILDPDSGECVVDVNFTLEHVAPRVGQIVRKYGDAEEAKLIMIDFEGTDEKVAVSFEGVGSEYEVTLSQYVDHSCKLSIDPYIRFVCIAKALE